MFPLRGNFQIIAVHKALNKNEVPLKQKHVRVLIVGTHKEKSSSVFWNTISRIQLEKNPVLTWKFCHLLHKVPLDHLSFWNTAVPGGRGFAYRMQASEGNRCCEPFAD